MAETFEFEMQEKVEKAVEKAVEKSGEKAIEKAIRLTGLSDEEIAEINDVPADLVSRIRSELKINK